MQECLLPRKKSEPFLVQSCGKSRTKKTSKIYRSQSSNSQLQSRNINRLCSKFSSVSKIKTKNQGKRKLANNLAYHLFLILLKQGFKIFVEFSNCLFSDENIAFSEMESEFRFLHALWAGKKDSHKYFKVLRILRKRDDFWESIFKPLYTSIGESDALLR